MSASKTIFRTNLHASNPHDALHGIARHVAAPRLGIHEDRDERRAHCWPRAFVFMVRVLNYDTRVSVNEKQRLRQAKGGQTRTESGAQGEQREGRDREVYTGCHKTRSVASFKIDSGH